MTDFVTWLVEGGIGPAAVGLPVNWVAAEVASAAKRWFRRYRRTDDLSRLVRAATGTSFELTHEEFDAVRLLLEDQQTWNLAGRGTVAELTGQIARCLSPRNELRAEELHSVAMMIARGLLEFTVADLDSNVFQRVLLTRLQRMETDQASALDTALLGMHTDLIARLAQRDGVDAQRFTSVLGQLKRVLDRLPPGIASLGEILVYLKALIDSLNTDPWPQDRRFGGPALIPATIERNLRVISTNTAMSRGRDENLDADGLVSRCRRLVILGGPGSGKTWLAKRAARRCAEEALQALASGASLDEVELPLYTDCSHLFTTDGGIREAVISSALDQLGDIGGSRISTALRMFFSERNTPTLLVIDSLDEARGPSERLSKAPTLPWRIVLTSRPSSWNYQLPIEEGDDCHRIGELQPLR